jgi:hypothetical protein
MQCPGAQTGITKLGVEAQGLCNGWPQCSINVIGFGCKCWNCRCILKGKYDKRVHCRTALRYVAGDGTL